MCSINGVFMHGEAISSYEWKDFERICINARARGRDSFGMKAFDKNGAMVHSIYDVKGDVNLKDFYPKTKIAISNNRAEPTTEYIKEKNVEHVQPFTSFDGRFSIVHNGTIANDKELAKKYNMKLKTSIDTEVIPNLLSAEFSTRHEFSVKELKQVITKNVKGSYSFLIHDNLQSERLYAITNYKPLFIEKVGEDLYYITSLKEFLVDYITKEQNLYHSIMQMPAYSACVITNYGVEEMQSIREPIKNPKTLVVCSGGLDSTVVAKMIQDRGDEVTLLHFKYKCRAEENEVQAVKDVANKLGVEALFVETDIFKNVIKHSPIIEGSKVEIAKGDKGVEFAHEWVPARNLIMLSVATGIAEAHSYDYIALGNNLEEAGAYPDNEEIFIKKFSEILPYAVNCDKQVQVLMPLGNFMKHEIVKEGLKIKAPLDLTWSCYENGEKHCGNCGPCRMRKVAFEMNKTKEVIEYEN